MFERNKKLDQLIIEVKKNNDILNELNYEELTIFVDYLQELKNFLKKGV